MEKTEKKMIRHQALEQFRSLRTNIKLKGDDFKVIAVTSAKPEEGKTSVATQLAKTLAEIGEKILIIDGDMRKSTIQEKFKLESKGLSEYLSSDVELTAVLRRITDNIDLIPAGEKTMDSTTILDSEKFKTMIRQIRGNYDRIIVDTPSFLGISDAIIIIKECDGVLLVIEENKVNKEIEREVVEKIRAMDAVLLGAVLNKVTLAENMNANLDYYALP